MRLTDLTVEVRDNTLARVGMIRPEDLDLELTATHNNVSTWTLKLHSEHPLASTLRTPGAGIIVTGPAGRLLSGPMVNPENAATAGDPAGTLTVPGVDDTVLLADSLAYPDPAGGAGSKKKPSDVRRGPVESLMHQFVDANIGPSAPAERRTGLLGRLTLGVNGNRGPTVVKAARFDQLGHLLTDLASLGRLGFRIIQRGTSLVFETYPVTDRTATVRLDIRNNTLAGHRIAVSAPAITRAIVAGSDEGVFRAVLPMNTPASLAAEGEWGRRIERFVDQRTTDLDQLRRAGNEALAAGGATQVAVQVVPMEDSTMRLGHDWGLGDAVTVVVDGQELTATVTGYVIKADREGFRCGALLGDPVGLDHTAALIRRVAATEARVSALERTAESTPAGARTLTAATVQADTSPAGYPPGETVLYLSAAQATADGWPWGAKAGVLRTTNLAGTGDLVQTWQATAAPELWLRGSTGTAFTAWRKATLA